MNCLKQQRTESSSVCVLGVIPPNACACPRPLLKLASWNKQQRTKDAGKRAHATSHVNDSKHAHKMHFNGWSERANTRACKKQAGSGFTMHPINYSVWMNLTSHRKSHSVWIQGLDHSVEHFYESNQNVWSRLSWARWYKSLIIISLTSAKGTSELICIA